MNLKEKNKEYVDWLGKKYSTIVYEYINRTAMIEDVMNRCIISHFIKWNGIDNSYVKLEDDFLRFVTGNIMFKTRYGMFKSILRERYKMTYCQYEDEIVALKDIYDQRNELAHATLHCPPSIIRKANKTRVLYMNYMKSNKPCELTFKQFLKDLVEMDKIFHSFEEIERKLYAGSPTP